MSRIREESAFVLHTRDYQDDSLLVELLTPGHGRVGAVARGARRSRRGRRGLLQPFRPLSLSWSRRGELATLSEVEAAGPALALTGEAVFSGFYLNELLLAGLRRDDAMPEVFDLYANTVAALAGAQVGAQPDAARTAAVLRRFETGLLSLLGYGLDLAHEADSGLAVDPSGRYRVEPGHGPVRTRVQEASGGAYAGRTLLDLSSGDFGSRESLREARDLTRSLIQAHLDTGTGRAREMLHSLRRLRMSDEP